MTNEKSHIVVKGVTMAYGSFVIQHDLNFTINHGNIFIIMGAAAAAKARL